jgi:hypothetical protein
MYDLVQSVHARMRATGLLFDMAQGMRPAPALPPPADEALLVRAEAFLGFPLPPELRALYLGVADGGFGPGYGMNPLGELVCQHRDALAGEGPTAGFTWRRGVLPLLTWGCGILSCCDALAPDAPVWTFDPHVHRLDGTSRAIWEDASGSVVSVLEQLDQPDRAAAVYVLACSSLRRWLEDWCTGVSLWERRFGE